MKMMRSSLSVRLAVLDRVSTQGLRSTTVKAFRKSTRTAEGKGHDPMLGIPAVGVREHDDRSSIGKEKMAWLNG
jgi:hypothetical protein